MTIKYKVKAKIVLHRCQDRGQHSFSVVTTTMQGHSQDFISTEAKETGGLGALPPAGSRGRAPGQEVRGKAP